MRKITFLKTFLITIALGIGNVAWGQTETYTYTTGDGTGSSTEMTYQSTNFTFLHKKNSSSSSIATTYAELRLYASHSMEIYPQVTGKTITAIEVTASSSSYATAMGNVSVIAGTSSSTAATISGISSVSGSVVTFNLSGVSGCEYVKFTMGAQYRTLSWKITYSNANSNAVSAPTFSPGAGNYFSTQNVSLTSSTSGAIIRYTTNGDDPTEASTEFTAPISVSTTTTIKAKAFKTGLDPSSIASATYSFPVEVANIAALRTETTGATVYKLTGEAFLTLKSSTRNVKYIQDATAGILIDDNGGVITTSYNAGDGITGIAGTLGVYNGMLQFTPVTDPDAATSTNNVISPIEITLNNISNYPGQLVKIKSLTIGNTGNFATSTNYNISDGTNSAVVRTQYSDLPYIGVAIPQGLQDITGVVLLYNTTAQLIPRTIDDFSASVVTSPTITVTEVAVPALTAYVGNNDTETIHVSGAALTADIAATITGTDAALFAVSPETLAQSTGNASGTLTITYTPAAIGDHTATLHLNSTGATEVTFELTGQATTPPVAPNVFISEVYGGGGNSGATYTNDFVELYNNSNASVDISNWNLVYYSSAGTGAGTVTSIPAGKYIPAKSNFLIQGASGSNAGSALPTADVEGTFNASGSAGKIILFSSSAEKSITSDLNSIIGDADFVDYVPYGTSSTPVWGSAMSSNPSNTTSASRKKEVGEYVYNFNIGTDFETVTPNPANTGITTLIATNFYKTQLRSSNGTIIFDSAAGKIVSVYNSVGQRITTAITSEGLNTIPIEARGLVLVKIGSEISKLIVE